VVLLIMCLGVKASESCRAVIAETGTVNSRKMIEYIDFTVGGRQAACERSIEVASAGRGGRSRTTGRTCLERPGGGHSEEEVGDFTHGPGPPGQVAAGDFERRVSGAKRTFSRWPSSLW
jgi:hypothetical protein